ncbi:hypothetical protein JB92DRAFT_1113614 [Gautieria morchelliformis]|nr:hypothetical protein JB92DRAFT_1113614 [Gautieria morchelliformis]
MPAGLKVGPSATPAPQGVRTRPSAQLAGTSMPPPASIPERTNSIPPTLSISSASRSNIRLQSPSVLILPSRINTVTPVVEPSQSRGILVTVSHSSRLLQRYLSLRHRQKLARMQRKQQWKKGPIRRDAQAPSQGNRIPRALRRVIPRKQ